MRPPLALALLLLGAVPSVGRAQERTCEFNVEGTTTSSEQGGVQIIQSPGPFEVRCSDGTVLRANSGTLNQGSGDVTLVGNVYFEDPERQLTADQATYQKLIGRLYATGDVVFTDRDQGTTLTGPAVEYFQAIEGRPESQVNATQRPHLTLKPRPHPDSAAAKPGTRPANDEPLDIDADRMTILGENDLSVSGNVVIVRPDLRATSGEGHYDGNTGALELRRNARVTSKDYVLTGEVVQAQMPDGQLQHVESRTHAALEGKELQVHAPELQMFFTDGELTRTVAQRGETSDSTAVQPVALARAFQLRADSLEAVLPHQQLRQVTAIGNARGESIDTTKSDSARAAAADSLLAHDWIVGDTILGFFASRDSVVPDSAAKPDSSVVLERIVARGNAQSLYHVQPKKPTGAAPDSARAGINFLAGKEIELNFEGGEVKVANVEGLRTGVYLDPVASADSAAADSVPADSVAGATTEPGSPPQRGTHASSATTQKSAPAAKPEGKG